jgi:hypothetical protein
MVNEVFNFNGLFGKVTAGVCRIDMKGRTAVKTTGGYKVYDLEKKSLINCASFCFDLGDECFFVLPTNHVEVGDIILINNTPKCVIKAEDNVITVLNYENSTIEQVVPEHHVFMGNTYFYGKIVSLMSGFFNAGNSEESGFNNILKFKMLTQLLNGRGSSGLGDLNGLLPLMLLQNGGNNLFGNLFDGLFQKKSQAAVNEKQAGPAKSAEA